MLNQGDTNRNRCTQRLVSCNTQGAIIPRDIVLDHYSAPGPRTILADFEPVPRVLINMTSSSAMAERPHGA